MFTDKQEIGPEEAFECLQERMSEQKTKIERNGQDQKKKRAILSFFNRRQKLKSIILFHVYLIPHALHNEENEKNRNV